MSSKQMWKFAFKNVWLNKTRSLLALVGLSIAIIGLLTLISLSGGIRAMVTDSISMFSGVFVMEKDVMDDSMSSVPLKYKSEIEDMQNVKVVASYITAVETGMDTSGGLRFGQVMGGMIPISGEDPSETSKLTDGGMYRKNLIRGRYLSSTDTNAAVMGAKIAEDYKKSVGSSFFFSTNKDKKYKVVGIFETKNEMMDRLVILPLEAVREITNKNKDYVNFFIVEPSNPQFEMKLINKINFKYDDVEAKTASEFGETAGSILDSLDSFFLLISSVAIAVGGIGILNTMLMSVMERFKEFGVLKAIGWSNTDILKLVMFESIILGIIGGLIGLILGNIVVALMAGLISFKPVVSIDLMITAMIIAVSLSIIGGLYPAMRAAKLDPVEAIRYA